MNNLLSLIQMLKGGNPQQILMNMLSEKSQGNNVLANVYQMAQGNNSAGLEQVARNLCKERGIDADAMFNQINQMMR